LSERWALMSRRDICDRTTGRLYMRRWRLVQTPWFGIYLHKIVQPDDDDCLHDHPWNFTSLVLRRGYLEELPGCKFMQRRAGSVIRHKASDAHRIHRLERGGPSWTLVLVGRKRQSWGFHTHDGWVDWRKHLGIDECVKHPTYTNTKGLDL
jgi:hypothetical protein